MSTFLERLSDPATLRRAWETVASRGGSPGIDRVSIEKYRSDLDDNLSRLVDRVRTRTYRPLPVLRIRPRFLAAQDRALVVLAVRDRVLHRAIADLLDPEIEARLSTACRAFRKGSSALKAADDVGGWIEAGAAWVLRTDIADFFDNIQPDLLQVMLGAHVDEEGLGFLRRILRSRVFDRHEISEPVVGLSQGSPLSPLLANLYLSEVDNTLQGDFPHYLRYCDDIIVLADSEEEVQGACDLVRCQIEPLGLDLNENKTRTCRAEDGFVFLGFHFGASGRGPAAKAVEALEFRLQQLTEVEPFDGEQLDAVYRGWCNYFGKHPEVWCRSLVGVLAFLRQGADPESLPALIAARWSLRSETPPGLAPELARAWLGSVREDQAWLEFAAACGGSRSAVSTMPAWAQLLGVDAEELSRLAGRLVGELEERLPILAEWLAEQERYGPASRLPSQQDLKQWSVGHTSERRGPRDLLEAADFPLLLSFFQGREALHATESVNRAGHRSFVPVQRALTADDWEAHLKGERTLALPLVRAGNTALVGVLDVDVEKKVLAANPPSAFLGRALGAARKVQAELQRRGCESLLELSGRKGYHVWVRLEEPLPVARVRRWLLDIVGAARPFAEGIGVEVLPSRDRVREGAAGPLIKLPLGVHSKTGRRCALLDEGGQDLEDPFVAIRELARVPADVVLSAGLHGEERPDSSGPAVASLGARVVQILDACHVLSYLAKRAEETSYLNHRERTSLLCVLGHLGEEGAAALHKVIGHTYNYRHQVTQRYIDRMPPYPISCPRLKESHPEAAALGCKCQFRLPGRAYPTPLLLALRPSEIAVFGQRKTVQRSSAAKPAGGRRAPRRRERQIDRSSETPEVKVIEEKVRKLLELRRHERGLAASVDRLIGELVAIFDETGSETMQIQMGTLKRVERADGCGWDFVIEI